MKMQTSLNFFSVVLIIISGMITTSAFAQKKYSLSIFQLDTIHANDYAAIKKQLITNQSFKDSLSAGKELQKIITNLQSGGYLSAAFDSVHYDSTASK